MRDLARLLRPRSVALYGGRWAENVAAQLQAAGYPGAIWPVHPTRADLRGIPCHRDLPGPPDAAFVGVNREATVGIVARLAAIGAGGAIAFAAGFRESDDPAGASLQARLIDAAGAMPVLGPNCYGFVNYLDAVPLWPDVHGGRPVETGVAIVTQSSNIAVNLTMQRRALPLAYVATGGNAAQTGLAEIAAALLADPRVTALGLHIEGFGDIRAFEAMAAAARTLAKPIVALKAGRSAPARAATLTHTASLAGNAAAASAFLARLGIAEVQTLAALLETLKLLHHGGPLAGPAIVSVSCSGGEASLMADAAVGTRLTYPALAPTRRAALAEILGPRVTIANPLDYHTFIWGDVPAMTAAFAAVLASGADLTVFVLDIPRADRCDPAAYDCAVASIIAARAATDGRAAVLASLPENLDEPAADRFAAAGVTPLHGMPEGIAGIDAAIRAGELARRPASRPAAVAARPDAASPLLEADAKAALARFGLAVPAAVAASDPETLLVAAQTLRFPLALKALGLAHKSGAGGVVLGIVSPEELRAAAAGMPERGAGLMAEEMVQGPATELLIGVVRDDTGLLALTVGAGGVLTELMQDTATLILPVARDDIRAALAGLKVGALLAGYRGRPPADMDALLDAVAAIARFAEAHAGRLAELEVNPLIAGPAGAVAVDAVIRLGAPPRSAPPARIGSPRGGWGQWESVAPGWTMVVSTCGHMVKPLILLENVFQN